MQPVTAALGHRPVFVPLSVKRDVDCTVIKRISTAMLAGKSVVRRENAADEGDDREPVPAVRAYRIDVPPDIAVGRNRRIEAKSAITASAAKRPEIAAIGTPGPGCVLPPAR